MRFGFVGASYTTRSLIGDVQRCMNLYPEEVESGAGKSQIVLHGTPGLTAFITLGTAPVRALFKTDENGERVLAVGGDTVYDLTEAGGSTSLGTIIADANPASIAYNRTQYLIVSGGNGYILTATTLTQISGADWPGASMCAYLDGYFIVIRPGTQEIWISALNDGTSWNALDFAAAEAAPDDLLSIFADHGELWLFGAEKTEVFYDSGNVDFPLQRIEGAIIEQGIDAAYSVAKVDNSLFWMGGSRRGRGVVYRANGFVPERVSNHAVEFAIQNYPTTSDARAYSYEEEGHEFYVLTFPTADATWAFDVATGMWHERSYWDPIVQTGFAASRATNHVYAFGAHLVGDRSSGVIYKQSLDVYDDNGDAIRRLRRAPHVSEELQWFFHHSFVIDMEVGVGLQTGQGSDPQVMMRFSDDGGHTWSTTRQASIGAVGQRITRVKFNRLGRSRDRVYEIVVSDPVKLAIVDAYLEVSRGTS